MTVSAVLSIGALAGSFVVMQTKHSRRSLLSGMLAVSAACLASIIPSPSSDLTPPAPAPPDPTDAAGEPLLDRAAPPAMVLVSGGRLHDDASAKLLDYIESMRRRKGFDRVLVLQAPDVDIQPGMSIRVVPLDYAA